MTRQALAQRRLRRKGLCVQTCGRRAQEGRSMCKTCARKVRARSNAYYARTKRQLEYYHERKKRRMA